MSVQNSFNTKAVPEFQIFLDLDGVIADFDTHATTQGKRKVNGDVDYDALDIVWWKTMPAFRGAQYFCDALKSIGTLKYLTAPTLGIDCYSGKAEWIKSFSGGRRMALQDLIICPKGDKKMLAGPNRILIDDSAENVANWVQAGGIGIHHCGDFHDTLARTEAAIMEAGKPKVKSRKRPSEPSL